VLRSRGRRTAIARNREFAKRAPRVDLRRPAILVDSKGGERDVTILDISRGGFRLETSEIPRVGEFVTVRVERDVGFAAQIRWALGNEAGGVFIEPADGSDRI
jgi:PilZ domain